jgi:hypothetical protein
MPALLRTLVICGALALWPATMSAWQAFNTLPPIGQAPRGTLTLFERIGFEFSPAAGSTLTDTTEISWTVRGTPSEGSFTFVLLFLREDGVLRFSSRGSLRSGGAGSKGPFSAVSGEPFFARGRRFDAVLLMQYSDNPTGFSLRTRETPRCIFFNCFGDSDDVIVWERVHYRRLIPLDWRRE